MICGLQLIEFTGQNNVIRYENHDYSRNIFVKHVNVYIVREFQVSQKEI